LSPTLSERVTTIGGVPVTAPAGWTLVNDSALAAALPTTTQECSFTGTGTAVDQNGPPVDASPAGEPSSTQSCSSSPIVYPAGLPVLQLANFEIPLLENVCGLGDNEPTSLPSDGVAVYVGSMSAVQTADMLAQCPGSENVTDGPSLETFGDDALRTIYSAIVVAGPSASSQDIELAQGYVHSLGGIRIHAAKPAEGVGPGYVVAAGDAGLSSWRLEAGITGITSLSQNYGTPGVGAMLVTMDGGVEGSESVVPPTTQDVVDDVWDLGTAGVVQFGTAKATVTGIDIVDKTGNATAATMLPWPVGIRTLDGVEGAVDGSIWYAFAAQRGDVTPITDSSPTVVPDPSVPPAERLSTSVNSEGVYVISGNDLGHDWELQQVSTGSLVFTIDGQPSDSELRLISGSGTEIDVPGGAFYISVQPPSLKRIHVTSDAAGMDTIAEGRWAPQADYAPGNANIWVTPVPGAGIGYAWVSDRPLPSVEEWPVASGPSPGGWIGSGDGPDVSWAMFWSEQGCPQLQVIAAVADGDTGSSAACPVSWDPQTSPHAVSYVGGVYGQHHAVVLMTGPDGMLADVQSDPHAGGTCGGSIARFGVWAQTGGCIFVIPVGENYVIQPTNMHGNPFGGTITITARPGRIDVGGAGF
jgi:hypothetical protein